MNLFSSSSSSKAKWESRSKSVVAVFFSHIEFQERGRKEGEAKNGMEKYNLPFCTSTEKDGDRVGDCLHLGNGLLQREGGDRG